MNPWREAVMEALELRRNALLAHLQIDPGQPRADQRAFIALRKQMGGSYSLPASEVETRKAFLSAARSKVSGFRLTVRDRSLKHFYAARHPRTRPPILAREQIIRLVREVDELGRSNGPHKTGVKRAINSLTETGQHFAHLKGRRHLLFSPRTLL